MHYATHCVSPASHPGNLPTCVSTAPGASRVTDPEIRQSLRSRRDVQAARPDVCAEGTQQLFTRRHYARASMLRARQSLSWQRSSTRSRLIIPEPADAPPAKRRFRRVNVRTMPAAALADSTVPASRAIRMPSSVFLQGVLPRRPHPHLVHNSLCLLGKRGAADARLLQLDDVASAPSPRWRGGKNPIPRSRGTPEMGHPIVTKQSAVPFPVCHRSHSCQPATRHGVTDSPQIMELSPLFEVTIVTVPL